MKSRRWWAFPALVLGLSSLLLARTINPDDDTDRPPALGATADLSNAPRVGVDRPKPTFPLFERDKRIHGLKPFQALVDAAKPGDVPVSYTHLDVYKRQLYHRRSASPLTPSYAGLECTLYFRTMLSFDCFRSMPNMQL